MGNSVNDKIRSRAMNIHRRAATSYQSHGQTEVTNLIPEAVRIFAKRDGETCGWVETIGAPFRHQKISKIKPSSRKASRASHMIAATAITYWADPSSRKTRRYITILQAAGTSERIVP
jgi:hypothetical protein